MSRLLAALCLLTLVAAEGSEDGKKQLARLQGDWIMTALEVNGQEVAADKIEGTSLTIDGDAYIVKVKKSVHRCRVTLHPGKDPAEIDMRFEEGPNKDKICKGIYKLEGNTFKVARGLNPEQDRPREFATWPDTNIFVVTWKRKGS